MSAATVRFEMGATGRVTAYEPPHLLEYTWSEKDLSRGPIVDALVRWELAEEGGRVRLTLTHSRLAENELLPTAPVGMHSCFAYPRASTGATPNS